MKPHNPRTRAEWQEAVDSADFFLLLNDARLYGLITGGPRVDVERCYHLLRRAKDLGIAPARLVASGPKGQ